MEVHASLRRLRMSPRKVRLVVDLIRGLSVREAETRLTFLEKGAALPVLKLLQSAMANAKHNHKLDPTTLVIAKITADGGPTVKRFRARAFGRAAPIRKRTTHISITLAPKGEVEQAPKTITKRMKAEKEIAQEEKTEAAQKTESKTQEKKPVTKAKPKPSSNA